jgi:hypothetical protein
MPIDKVKTETTFTFINFREQIAVEDDGTVWAFDQCIDYDGDEITADCEVKDIAVIVVKHPSGLAWCTIIVDDFEDVKGLN